MQTKQEPMTQWEREERVLRILASPSRHDALSAAAYDAQLKRMRRMRHARPSQAVDDTNVPCAWHATVEGEPA